MGKKINLSGNKFGRLLVLSESGRTRKKAVLWKCYCDCGNHTVVDSYNLVSGNTKSCGCLSIELSIKRKTTHGHAGKGKRSKEYNCYLGIKKGVTIRNLRNIKIMVKEE